MASVETSITTENPTESTVEIKEEPIERDDSQEGVDNDQEDQSNNEKDSPMNADSNITTDDNEVKAETTATTESTTTSTNNNDTNNNDTATESTSDDKNKTNLIVNYLPQQMTDEEFENLFKGYGPRKSCKIVRNRSTGYSYGFGFVDFETHDQAIRAINDLNGHELDSKRIKVAFARPAGQDIKQANLYVKNVPNSWSQDEVRKVFEPYGDIIQVRVLGNDRGVAFVLFDLRKQAEDALEALNGKKLDNCELPFEIKFAADKKVDKQNNKNNSNNNSNTNNSNNNNNNNNAVPGKPRRERGQRGGRNRNRDRHRQGDDKRSGGSFFDRQRDNQHHDRRGGQHNNQYGNNSIQPFNNNLNGYGPVRQQAVGRMNRYAPFAPVRQQQQQPQQQPIMSAAPMATPMGAYGYPTQNPLIPAFMMPQHQQAAMMPQAMQMNHTMAGAYQPPVSQMQQQHPVGGYVAPLITQNAMNNIYSVASNTMQNAAQMQPQLGQPMSMRASSGNVSTGGGGSGAYGDDGITLFVYNIGPNSDEAELSSMFGPYGQVVKCNVVRKTPGGETKGFGFVTLKNKSQANAAILALNGSTRNGRTLQVSLKK